MKRRSSNQIRNFIICFVIFMMLALVAQYDPRNGMGILPAREDMMIILP